MDDMKTKLEAMQAAMEAHVSGYMEAVATGWTPPEVEGRTCLSYWFPKISGLVPVPRTEIVHTNCSLWPLLDGVLPGDGWSAFLFAMNTAIGKITDNELPAPPVFLRTGYTSGKHSWDRTCYFNGANGTLISHIAELVDFSSMADLPFGVWVVREMLKVPSQFKCAAYCGMPVTPERRYFVDGADLLYSIPYWPADALEQGRPDDPEWRNKLAIIQMEFPQEAAEMARKCGAACGGKWSVDVLLTGRGPVVTDMAEAERSWGWNPEKVGT